MYPSSAPNKRNDYNVHVHISAMRECGNPGKYLLIKLHYSKLKRLLSLYT